MPTTLKSEPNPSKNTVLVSITSHVYQANTILLRPRCYHVELNLKYPPRHTVRGRNIWGETWTKHLIFLLTLPTDDEQHEGILGDDRSLADNRRLCAKSEIQEHLTVPIAEEMLRYVG